MKKHLKKLIILSALILTLSGCSTLFSLVTDNALRGIAIITSLELIEYAYDKGVENQEYNEPFTDDEGED